MPLRTLNPGNTRVMNLTPLTGKNVREIRIPGTAVASLGPLRGTEIVKLDLGRLEDLIDLSPLAECLSLESLVLSPNSRDIGFLRSLPKLKRISYRIDGEKTQWSLAQTTDEFWGGQDEETGRE